MRSRSALAAGIAVALVSVLALPAYRGSTSVFVFFAVAFAAMLALVLPQPRSYAYTFLAVLTALGLWAKTLVHTAWNISFLEPTGDFANTPEEWDRALLAMACAALGLGAARGLQLWYRARTPFAWPRAAAPRWLVRWRVPVWAATLLMILAVNAANAHFAFLQIGVNTKLVLPLRLHVLLAWLVNIGFALWIAALLWWETLDRPGRLQRTLLAPMLEAMVSSVSAFSRSIYLVHAVPYALALWEERARPGLALGRRRALALGAVFLAFFAAAVVAVFWLRITYYPLVERNTGAVVQQTVRGQMGHEIPQLLVRRWIGLEGVLAVGAAGLSGTQSLREAVTDSPKRGSDSLFQRISKPQAYRVDANTFTFLTNAGPVAILLFSGSVWIVLAGMALIGLVVLFTEESLLRLTGNPFLAAVAGAGFANVVSQTTFFYLTLVFLLQLSVAIAFIALLQRLKLSPNEHL